MNTNNYATEYLQNRFDDNFFLPNKVTEFTTIFTDGVTTYTVVLLTQIIIILCMIMKIDWKLQILFYSTIPFMQK